MRKTISLVLVAAMLLTMIMVLPTSAATLDENNVQIDAQYFEGKTTYQEIYGTQQDGYGWEGAETIKEGDESKGLLNIDGIIDEGEWTEVVYHIDSDYAPNSGNAYGNNALFEVPSAENTFFRWMKDGNNKSMAPANGLEYDVRFMWDEKFFYMAVEYIDADGHINAGQAAAGNSWDGDSIQFRLDPYGPNAVVKGQGYDASVDSFPYDPDIHGETDTTPDCTFPWAAYETEYNSFAEETHSTIGNFVFSYYTAGYTDMCDTSKRYFPEETEVDVELEDGSVGTKTVTTWYPADLSEWGQLIETEPEKQAYASIYVHDINPHPAFNEDLACYEIALPWALVADDYAPAANNELGFSMVRFNAKLGGSNNLQNSAYNSYLAWGSGICGYETKDMPQVCGGSNCLVLTDVKASETEAHEHDFAPATCVEPETCACGYQRGFVTGHKNTYSNFSLPTGSGDGSISAVCTVCGEAFTHTIPSREASVKFDFLQTENSIFDQGWRSEGGFCIQWETLDENGSRYTDETDPTGTLRKKLWNDDGSAKNSFNTTEFGYSVSDLTVDGQTGTYFDANSYEVSYTQALEVYFTKIPLTSEVDSTNPYNTYFGEWFGGESGVSYLAGLINVENSWFFAILPSTHQNPQSLDEFYEHALSYTEATADMMALKEWHSFVFMYDNNAEAAMLFWNDQLVAAATDYHFRTSRNDIQAIFIKHNAEAYVKNVQVGSTGLAAQLTNCIPEGTGGGEVVEPEKSYTVTVNGVETTVKAGETINIEAIAFYGDGGDFYRFNGWTGDVDGIADADAAATTLTVDGDITIEASYYFVGDLNGDLRRNAADSNILKRMITGDEEFNPAGDMDFNGSATGADSNCFSRWLVFNWEPSK